MVIGCINVVEWCGIGSISKWFVLVNNFCLCF